MREKIRIATRKSELAQWQARHIGARLQANHPSIEIELVPLVTTGDKFLQVRLSKIGGKGVFVKELEQAILEDRADMAVHSMKDVPAIFPKELELAVICEREDPRDAFVSEHFGHLEAVPKNGVIGTSSLRRQSQIKALRPDIQIEPLRGNINTRLKKSVDFDAIVLASAGLKRLKLEHFIQKNFAPDELLPAVGQGALGIECRKDDSKLKNLIQTLACPISTRCILAERAFNHRLNGSCQVPIAGYCTEDKTGLTLTALVATPDGSIMLKTKQHGEKAQPKKLGEKAANALIAEGAMEILNAL